MNEKIPDPTRSSNENKRPTTKARTDEGRRTQKRQWTLREGATDDHFLRARTQRTLVKTSGGRCVLYIYHSAVIHTSVPTYPPGTLTRQETRNAAAFRCVVQYTRGSNTSCRRTNKPTLLLTSQQIGCSDMTSTQNLDQRIVPNK